MEEAAVSAAIAPRIVTGRAARGSAGETVMGEVASDAADDRAGHAARLGLGHGDRPESRESRHGDDDLAHSEPLF